MSKPINNYDDTLSQEVLELLTDASSAEKAPAALVAKTRTELLQRIATLDGNNRAANAQGPESQAAEELSTIRQDEGEWRQIGEKLHIKYLMRNRDEGIASYLFRLDPGFEHDGHDHPFDEECLVLEGSCVIDDHDLQVGDFHFAPKGGRHHFVSSHQGALLYIRGADPLA